MSIGPLASDLLISGRSRDIGGFSVARTLPSPKRRQVGPFVFLDHMGPAQIDEQHALDVRPHPHIGLSTVTYLFSGQGIHRDSLGSVQMITPGDLNWMTAGKGIVHSERSPQEDRKADNREPMHGVQIWVALPKEYEQCEPNFMHYGKEVLPPFEPAPGLQGRLLIGSIGATASPVRCYSRTFFADLHATVKVDATLEFPEQELAFFVIAGSASINGQAAHPNDLVIVAKPQSVVFHCDVGTRIVVLGGDPLPEPRYIWWNFVASDKALIKAAAQRWTSQEMGRVPGETEFIPLPSDPI